jgi:hypothetical protein
MAVWSFWFSLRNLVRSGAAFDPLQLRAHTCADTRHGSVPIADHCPFSSMLKSAPWVHSS